MKKIALVAPFVSLPGEPQFNRFLYLCYLWSKTYEVTLVTSAFCHSTKRQRDRDNERWRDLPFKLALLDEPGYRSNVSFSRFWSHRVFHQSFQGWLDSQLIAQTGGDFPFDIVYSAFPLISTNLTLGKLRSSFKFKFVIDVQDIWPDSIFSALPFLAQADFLISSLRAKAHQAYSYADGLVAVSKTYLDVALSRRRSQVPTHVTYLGSDYQLIESIEAQSLGSDKIRLLYIGTLSHSYDMKTVVLGFAKLSASFDNVELHILGDGPDRARLEKISGADVFYHGYLPYVEMVAFAKACHIAVNPIVGSAMQSVTNKLSDYVAFGLPILSSQKNWEAMEIVKAQGGYWFEAGSAESFAIAAKQAITDCLKQSRRSHGLVNKRAHKRTHERAHERVMTSTKPRHKTDLLFDRRVSYPQITEFIESL